MLSVESYALPIHREGFLFPTRSISVNNRLVGYTNLQSVRLSPKFTRLLSKVHVCGKVTN